MNMNGSNLPGDKGKKFSKILVAVDGSEASTDAAYYTTELARKYNSELIALHVILSDVTIFGTNPPRDIEELKNRPLELIVFIYLNLISSMSKVKSYFETHAHHHAYHTDQVVYRSIIDRILNMNLKEKIKILDIGCGHGTFIESALSSGVDGSFFGTDVSLNMVHMAKANLNQRAELFVADGFSLPLRPDTKFDIIHLDSVLHHLVGETKGQSLDLVERLLGLLVDRLSETGILVIEEVYYDSFVISSITSSIVFYGLKLVNFFNLDIRKVVTEFEPGLEVNFLSEKQIERLLKRHGFAHLLLKVHWKVPKLYRLFLLREIGHISYIVARSGPRRLSNRV
jgi:SAM-dependent methyltransferase